MLVGIEQKLDSLPSHIAFPRQRRHGRRCEWIGCRLQRVEAAERSVDERQRGMRRFGEEGIVVTPDEAIECSQLFGSKALQMPWRNVLDLYV